MTERRPAIGRLTIALVATALIALLEFWGGAASRSLALTGDAVHVCMDVVALGLALIAAIGAARPADARRTFGYGRIEVLGALVNGTLLLVATVAIVYFAVRRFSAPVEPSAALMTAVAAAGLAVNAAVGLSLRAAGKSDINVRAALFHIVGDALGAFAVIVGGVAIALTHFAWIDPLLSLFVAAIIVSGVVRLLRDATNVLLESVPGDVDSADLVKRLKRIAGVSDVHDLHVWSIGSGSHALSAHVALDDRRISEATEVLRQIDCCAKEDFGIDHVTIQFECERCPVAVRH
ncbi:MAG TPA: cation diffusion facilitator family transporter [Candidatus Cybelea sp.]|jgi:cobalt-zinc-cadmium efflux system protein|nr:cation diffusion facilitator family transporter [Candidatus Cybelea sp.]